MLYESEFENEMCVFCFVLQIRDWIKSIFGFEGLCEPFILFIDKYIETQRQNV